MTEFWVCFSCCIAEQPQPVSILEIPSTVTDEPLALAEMGSGDMGNGPGSAGLIQEQMKSKGGYGNEMSNVQE
ncbi:CDC42 small effector protein 2-A-like [Huso huso]|uniref:CDC42 small effector protein 2-A-like n=1 Tax=Huso huso TaxID=61971 RepID=A0ABR0YVY1_HUSHU